MADIAELDIQRKRQYRAELIRTEAMSREALDDYARAQWLHLGRFAWRNVPYWRKRLAPVFASGGLDAAAWSRVAPLTRAIATSKFGELTAAAVPAFAGKTHDGLTSGSTGVPLRYRASATDGIANAALTERSYDWWRLEPQLTLASIQSFPADWPNLVEGGTRGWRNGMPPGRSLALQIAEHVDKQLDWLQRWRPAYLYSRSSQIEALAEAKLRRGLDLPLKLVMTVGGPVSQVCRELCRQAFGAEIFDTYGSSECGHLAAECPDCRLLHVSAEARLIEVVRDDGMPCAPGEIGRVLVTSYTNFAMPLIRYEIGDYAEAGPVQAPCGRPFPSLVRVLGREIETFVRHDGTRFFPTLFGRILRQAMPFKQVQFVQTDYGVVEIRYVAVDGNPPIDGDAVQRCVKAHIGNEFTATLVPLADIPRRPGAKYFYHRCEVPGVVAAR